MFEGIPVAKHLFKMQLEAALNNMVSIFEMAYQAVGIKDFSRIYAFEKAFREMVKEYNDACDNLRRTRGTPDVQGGETPNKKT